MTQREREQARSETLGSSGDGETSRGRARLGAEQAALLASLRTGAPAPLGFDAAALAVAASSLAHKRNRTAAQVWPRLARRLGPAWNDRFTEHVAPLELLRLHGPLCDGWRLAEALEARGQLDPESSEELALVRARYRRTASGALRRSFFGVGVAPGCCFIALFGSIVRLRGLRRG